MLLGLYKNVAELERSLSLPELEHMVKSMYERERRQQRFAAALKGINLDEADAESVRERFEASKRRAEAIRTGQSVKKLEYEEFGIDIEVEE